jgi:hypothetical protein
MKKPTSPTSIGRRLMSREELELEAAVARVLYEAPVVWLGGLPYFSSSEQAFGGRWQRHTLVPSYLREPAATLVLIARAQARGSSLIMNYGEDTDTWEVSWITGGRRYVGVHRRLEHALCLAVAKAGQS